MVGHKKRNTIRYKRFLRKNLVINSYWWYDNSFEGYVELIKIEHITGTVVRVASYPPIESKEETPISRPHWFSTFINRISMATEEDWLVATIQGYCSV